MNPVYSVPLTWPLTGKECDIGGRGVDKAVTTSGREVQEALVKFRAHTQAGPARLRQRLLPTCARTAPTLLPPGRDPYGPGSLRHFRSPLLCLSATCHSHLAAPSTFPEERPRCTQRLSLCYLETIPNGACTWIRAAAAQRSAQGGKRHAGAWGTRLRTGPTRAQG